MVDTTLDASRRLTIRASTLHLRRLPTRRRLQPMLHGMIIAGDNLPANSLGKMNHQRRFQIERRVCRRHC